MGISFRVVMARMCALSFDMLQEIFTAGCAGGSARIPLPLLKWMAGGGSWTWRDLVGGSSNIVSER